MVSFAGIKKESLVILFWWIRGAVMIGLIVDSFENFRFTKEESFNGTFVVMIM